MGGEGWEGLVLGGMDYPYEGLYGYIPWLRDSSPRGTKVNSLSSCLGVWEPWSGSVNLLGGQGDLESILIALCIVPLK